MTGICELKIGDALQILKIMDSESVDCCVTSPPYWGLRDYGNDGQLGMEATPQEYVEKIVQTCKEVKRVLKKEGTLWLNLGDTYVGTGAKGKHRDPKNPDGRNAQISEPKNNKVDGLKSKDLVGIPWRVAFALQADGWYLRNDIIWNKGNAMPESVTDRMTRSHEYVFLLSKSKKYYFDFNAVKEPCTASSVKDHLGRKEKNNKGGGGFGEVRPDLARSRDDYMPKDFMRRRRSVWTVNTKPYKGAHFAVYPPDLILPCVLAGCPKDGVVLDPFAGSGTTGLVAAELGRRSILIELNPDYGKLIEARLGLFMA